MQFSFSRFSYLCKLQFATNRKLYLLGIAAIAGIMLCYMLYAAFTFKGGLQLQYQKDFIAIALVITGAFFGSLIFKQYGNKSQRIQTILLPVANTERLAVGILFAFILFPLVFILLYFICVCVVNAIDVHILGNMNDIYRLDGMEGWQLTMLFCFVQSIAFLGAIWFRRFTFVKTIVAVCLSGILLSLINDMFNNIVLKGAEQHVAAYAAKVDKTPYPPGYMHFEIISSAPYQSLQFYGINTAGGYLPNASYWVSLPDDQLALFGILLGCIPLFFFYLTAVKLREQQL